MNGIVSLLNRLAWVIAIGLTWASASHAAIQASSDNSMPSTTTQHLGTQGGGFSVTEDVSHDANAGPWIKQFVNNGGGGIASGSNVQILESFYNDGQEIWTDWHEEILSTTMVPGGAVGGGGGGGGGMQTVPGFLFRSGSLVVKKNGGTLTEGSDYTLVTMDHTGSFADSGPNWESIWIFFEPGSLIAPGDTLAIEKQIFEVFNDGNVWQPSEYAEVAQYPTIGAVPEPASMLVWFVICATLFVLGRNGSMKRFASRVSGA